MMRTSVRPWLSQPAVPVTIDASGAFNSSGCDYTQTSWAKLEDEYASDVTINTVDGEQTGYTDNDYSLMLRTSECALLEVI